MRGTSEQLRTLNSCVFHLWPGGKTGKHCICFKGRVDRSMRDAPRCSIVARAGALHTMPSMPTFRLSSLWIRRWASPCTVARGQAILAMLARLGKPRDQCGFLGWIVRTLQPRMKPYKLFSSTNKNTFSTNIDCTHIYIYIIYILFRI